MRAVLCDADVVPKQQQCVEFDILSDGCWLVWLYMITIAMLIEMTAGDCCIQLLVCWHPN